LSSGRPAPLHALTGLRFVAALHVLLFHFGSPLASWLPTWAHRIVGSGFVGVGLFFLLSGFILAYSYPELGESWVARRQFWLARFARVYPVFAAAFVASVPFVVASALEFHPPLVASARLLITGLSSLTLLESWTPWTASGWNYPSWSLSVEALLYALFPFVLPLAKRVRFPLLTIVALWLAALAIPALVSSLLPVALHATPASTSGVVKLVRYFPLLHVPAFLMGILLGRLFLHRSRLSGRRSAGLAAAGAGGALAILMVSDRVPHLVLHNGLLLPAFAALIYGLAHGRGALVWVLSSRPLVLLGEASYSLYLFQVPLFEAAKWVAVRGGMAVNSIAFVLSYVAFAVATSLVVFRYLEEPARRRLRTLAASRPSESTGLSGVAA
jgi:peptidoglycan/LPS O-acetylase OafA/YrhL